MLELSSTESEAHARECFKMVLGEAIESDCVRDAVIAGSMAKSQALWHLRKSQRSAPHHESGRGVGHGFRLRRCPSVAHSADPCIMQRSQAEVHGVQFLA
ncbi:MAG: hypothetical protein ABI040_02615 [Rhodoferax sp.]